jgi:NAD(P)-dependent dehydrogenase (short-subunit alcohol dehydrogenase family)
MSKTFENKIVLVTGGTSGIGRATAIAFAREGATVVVSGRRKAEGAETVNYVQKAGGKGLFIQCDVSDEAQVKSLVEATVREFGRLDIAVNNAGIEGTPGPFVDATVDQYTKLFDINVKGVFLSMKYEIPAMLKSGGGSIVNTSSAAGSNGFPTMGLYVATKHAVNGLTKTAALEYARQGIRVNTVSPAGVETDMLQRFVGKPGDADTEARKGFAESHPVGRFGTPEEIAAAILFLSAPTSGFVTGHDLLVDGGYSAR